jgi:hypothetical protein
MEETPEVAWYELNGSAQVARSLSVAAVAPHDGRAKLATLMLPQVRFGRQLFSTISLKTRPRDCEEIGLGTTVWDVFSAK